LDTKRYFGKGEEVVLFLSVAWKQGQKVFPWVRWEQIAAPKTLGGWGLNNLFSFSKALATKNSWRLIKTTSLWTRVVHQKSIAPLSTLDWI
jgi:hypothetical protein